MWGLDWIHLPLDRDQWRALVNTVLKLHVHKVLGNFSVAQWLGASEEGLGSIELVTPTHGLPLWALNTLPIFAQRVAALPTRSVAAITSQSAG
jgi:hypothetical protein